MWYFEHLYDKLLAETLRTLDVDEDLKQFIELIAMAIDDRNDEVYSFPDIWDIDRCPSKYLPYIAQLIGWWFGPEDSEAQMRSQLKLAVPFYRKKGIEEAFRILCYSYGFYIDVLPLWSSQEKQYKDFVPHVDDPPFIDDTPPIADLHPAFDGTATLFKGLYPTPHIGIDLTGFVGVPTFAQFDYMVERVHDIRPAHVVLDWIRFFVECFDFVTFTDEDGLGELIVVTKDITPWPGCFWRGRGCLFPFYRDGTIKNRRGPGGFYPIQDYTAGYPPNDDDPLTSGVVDVPFSDPTVNLEPDDPGSPMPDNPPYSWLHVRDPDTSCPQPRRDGFDYDIAYHLRDGSSWMRRNTPRPPGPHYFRDGQGLEKCNGDNTPWLGPVPWSSRYDADVDVPDVETPPWVHVAPGGNPPVVTVSGGLLSVSHDFDAGASDVEGWEIKVTDDSLGALDYENAYTFDIRVMIPDSPAAAYTTPASSVPLSIRMVGARPSVPENRLLTVEVFKEGIRNGADASVRIDHDFTDPTLLRIIVVDDLVVIHVEGRRVLYSNDGTWLVVTTDPQEVDVSFGPLLVAGETSTVDVEWIRLLLDAASFGPGRDYWTEYTTRTWDGWCCPPDDPLPGSPLRWYCCKEDTLSIESSDPAGIAELGGPILYV